ncbi:MAG: deoxyguanosinetriphosphate triphosphohydrolase [Planctomycetota bacterium]|nr:MAG: deoxyguanosinetriphosphate triphosphohydrolase [Planctomycetota bacterium]
MNILLDRTTKEAREERELAPWAMRSARSLGRRHPEQPDALRTVFERDRDRVVHSTAFRRLMYKTQVFVNSEGDEYRTRLSHSLEVCQVARSVGSALRLNEPLCEALALAHDLGHPPFGHRGERALDAIMAGHGGFRHNSQVLRVVDQLERRHPDFPGLNLTREVRESLLKHERSADWPEEFAPRPAHPLLEGQVVDLADSTAYDKHDIEDGLSAGMFTEEALQAGAELWRESRARVEARHPGFLAGTTDDKLLVQRIANELIGACITDLIQSSAARIEQSGVASPQEVQSAERMLIGHGPEMNPKVAELQRFLHEHFYRHEHLQRFLVYARKILGGLFEAYRAEPEELSPWYRGWADEVGLERAICDYIAGMTDRFAEQEYARLVGRSVVEDAD